MMHIGGHGPSADCAPWCLRLRRSRPLLGRVMGQGDFIPSPCVERCLGDKPGGLVVLGLGLVALLPDGGIHVVQPAVAFVSLIPVVHALSPLLRTCRIRWLSRWASSPSSRMTFRHPVYLSPFDQALLPPVRPLRDAHAGTKLVGDCTIHSVIGVVLVCDFIRSFLKSFSEHGLNLCNNRCA